jgi:hypothetical protein
MKYKLIFLFLISSIVFGQQKQLETSIDTTKNKIGAEFKLILKTHISGNQTVVFPELKNIGALEVINSYKIDTVKKESKLELIKKYGLTQFDSGRYTIAPVKVLIDNKPYLSDSIQVEVANIQVDTLKQKMYDIKDVIAVEKPMGSWWKYLLGILFILGIAALIYYLLKRKKILKIKKEVPKTPIEKATFLLNNLEEKKLWQKGEVKEYYSELTNIARNYIEEAVNIPAMESTTSELISGLKAASEKKNMMLTPEIITNLETVLNQADLVKFAKSKPIESEIENDKVKIQKTIVTLDKAIPVEEISKEDELNEQKKLELAKAKAKKKRRKIIVFSIAASIYILLITFIYLSISSGFQNTIDTILGNPTKKLLDEKEWITSSYGNPPIEVETPKVLERKVVADNMPPEVKALIKDMQTFVYGDIFSTFFVEVQTISLKETQEVDLNKSLEGLVQEMQSRGATNITVKQEEAQTDQGVKVLKCHGTFSTPNGMDGVKMEYQIYLFNYQGGIQHIAIAHKEGDNYAQQIAERILASAKLIQESHE